MSEGLDLSNNIVETGVFQINGDTLELKEKGDANYEYVDFSINGTRLTLGYANVTEVYDKV